MSKEQKEEKQAEKGQAEGPEVIENQKCPMCFKDTLTLMEHDTEVPFFGPVLVFSMDCSSCNYHKADVECAEQHEPSRYTILVETEKDLNVRVIKSSTATVKIPRVMSIEPGAASNGYVTNVEGVLNRVKVQLEKTRDLSEDEEDRKKAKNLLKKVQAALWGHDTIEIIIEDPEGNSAILSEKAKKEVLKNSLKNKISKNYS